MHDVQHTEVLAILEAAADVIFSDGVSAEFLEHWTTATIDLIARRVESRPVPVGAPA